MHTEDILHHIAQVSGLSNYNGIFRPLGGGELNDTYLLSAEPSHVVVRVAKYNDQNTLSYEARALSLLHLDEVPRLIFFDEHERVDGKQWIAESYLEGTTTPRLTAVQYEQLGCLLAHVHRVQSEKNMGDIWDALQSECEDFGGEEFLLNHPDPVLGTIMRAAMEYFVSKQSVMHTVRESLIHGDATPSNVLVRGDHVGLIDWELSKFRDPMAEFSTMYYEDMEYNKGKWRVHITDEERTALFRGYERGGGAIDEERVRLWMLFDKVSAAAFLYWRIHSSGRLATDTQMAQYRLDYDNLIHSLNAVLG